MKTVSKTVGIAAMTHTMIDMGAFGMMTMKAMVSNASVMSAMAAMVRDSVMDAVNAVQAVMISVTVGALANDAVHIVENVRETVMMRLTDETVAMFAHNHTIMKGSNVTQAQVMQSETKTNAMSQVRITNGESTGKESGQTGQGTNLRKTTID